MPRYTDEIIANLIDGRLIGQKQKRLSLAPKIPKDSIKL